MKAFNKQRFNLINMKGVKKYVLYAIGEIILVVIGILIAVNINYANETRKANQQFNTILNTYRQDVVTDTMLIAQHMQFLDLKKEAFDLFLSDTLTVEDYKLNPFGYSLITSHNPFRLQEKGLKLLEDHTDKSTKKTDSLVIRILATHHAYKTLLVQSQERINRDIDDNLSFLKNNKNWLKDLLNKNYTTEINSYFMSKDYFNRLALHKVYVVDNYISFLKAYHTSAKSILDLLDERLNTN